MNEFEAAPKDLNIFIELTDQCNLQCSHCISVIKSNIQRNKRRTDVDNKKIIKLANEIIEFQPQHIYFHGYGEQTYSPEFFTVAKKFLKKRIPTSIITNMAKKYTEQEIDILSHFESVRVSLDAANRELCKKLRGGLNLDIFISNIIRIHAMAELHNKKQFFAAGTVLSNQNILELKNIYFLAKHLGITCIDLIPIMLFGKEVRTLDGRVLTECTQLEEEYKQKATIMYHDLERIAEEDNIMLNIYGYNNFEDIFESRTSKKIISNYKYYCIAPWQDIFIQCNGDVTFCCQTLHATKYTLGNIYESSIGQVIKGEKARKFRRNFLSGKDCDPVCPHKKMYNITTLKHLQKHVQGMYR